jgi:hypothetical protein
MAQMLQSQQTAAKNQSHAQITTQDLNNMISNGKGQPLNPLNLQGGSTTSPGGINRDAGNQNQRTPQIDLRKIFGQFVG